MKAVKVILIILICLACLFTLYLGGIFVIGSGFIFVGDIDLTDEQRQAAQIWVNGGTIFGVILVIGSTITMFLSGTISNRILKLFGAKSDE